MQEGTDNELLLEYVTRHSEKAFATLVARHINKVYSAALRHTRNPSHAEEITQAVFIILARKAPSLSRHTVLSGWLYQTARLSSATFLRSEIRRARREQEAHMQSNPPSAKDSDWEQLAPMLDEAMANLAQKDRDAVVLRFFDGKSMREVGQILSASEDATKKRVNRAVEKLRIFFSRRGVTFSAAVICGVLSANAAQGAPAHLAASINSAAMGGTAAASTVTLVEGVLKWMAWLKLKTAAAVSAVVIAGAGATTVAVNAFHSSVEVEQVRADVIEGWGTVINPDGDCTLTFTNNRLVVQIPGSDHVLMPERGKLNAPRVLQEVEGDFTLQVKVSGAFPEGARTAAKGRRPYQDCGLLIWIDEKNNLKLARAQVVVDGKTQRFFNLEFRHKGEYGTFPSQQPAHLLQARAVYLRFQRRGDTIEAGVSADGKQWVSGPLPSGPVPKKMRVGIIAQHNTYSPLTAQFEEFKLTRNFGN